MKKFFCSLLCITFLITNLVFIPAVTFAADANGLTYKLDTKNRTATIGYCEPSVTTLNIPRYIYYNYESYSVVSVDDDAFDDCTVLKSVYIPYTFTSGLNRYVFSNCKKLESITVDISNTTYSSYDGVLYSGSELIFCPQGKKGTVTIPDFVTTIGSYAFSDCSSLKNVTIGKSVTTIGSSAFEDCSSLTSVAIPDSVTTIGSYAFEYCSSLTSVTIPDSVTTIGNYAFSDCSSLTSATIGKSVTTIGSSAFSYCSSLASITVSEENKTFCTIDGIVYSKDKTKLVLCPKGKKGVVTIPDSVTTIESDAFKNCSSLTSATIGNSVTTIGSSTFEDCSSLTSVTIPDSVTTIGSSAFEDCSSLTSATIGNSVTTIGNYAFYNCSSLTNVTIGKSVTTIGSSAFSYCSSLASITVSEENKTFCTIDGIVYSKDKTKLVLCPKGKKGVVTIPDSVTTIGSSAFYYCSSITSVTIPDSVTTIGSSAFYYCSSLTSVAIPDLVTTIGSYAFEYCSSLISVTISKNTKKIEPYAFYGCSSLMYVNYSGTQSNKSAISIDSSNNNFKNAEWHYNVNINCNHTYSDTCDHSCNTCGFVRIDLHIYDNEADITCNNCDFFRYLKLNFNATDLTATISSCDKSVKSITIPDTVSKDGTVYRLNSIGSSAFNNCSSLTSITVSEENETFCTLDGVVYSKDKTKLILCPRGKKGVVTIPDFVTTIGSSAFEDCSSLTSVTIPDSVTTIGSSAFEDCSSLTSVTIPDSVTTIGSSAFEYCSSLTSVTIPDSVTTIGNYAFYYCSSLTSVTIPDSVTTIGSYAFERCSSLTSATIGNSVTTIGNYAFYNCSSLTSITVSEENETFCTLDGIVYSKDKTKLVLCPQGKKGVVTIPDSVTTIGSYAFYYCSLLENIVLPKSVTKVDSYAFYGCSLLENVHYKGSSYYKDNITVNSGNDCFKNAQWYFNIITENGHVYDNACDTQCNICESVRQVPPHIYSNGCDAYCNSCNFKREVMPHIYDNVCDSYCNECNSYRSAHVYDNACDAICNECGYKRTTYGHYYEKYYCSSECYECGYKRTPPHYFGNECIDGTCDYCGETRYVRGYHYASGCATTCFDCGVKFQTAYYQHTYISEYSDGCMDCPEGSRVAPLVAECDYMNNEYTLVKCNYAINELTYLSDFYYYWDGKVTSIADNVFWGYSNLHEVALPDHFYSIGASAFKKCTSLEEINLENVRIIGNYAFQNCSSLKEINLSQDLETLGTAAFYGCSSLEKVQIPSSVKSVSSYAFTECTGLKNVILPSSVTVVSNYAFDGCTGITDVWFEGSEQSAPSVRTGNDAIKNATWHYNVIIDGDHIYDNVCDATCNICDNTRTVEEHEYDNDCDAECNFCGGQRTVPGHVYENNCDADCSVCSFVRVPADHIYSNDCDADCNECFATRIPLEHVFDNICDSECNVCGFERQPQHNFVIKQNALYHWQLCVLCKTILNKEEHGFKHEYDSTCESCNYVRTVQLPSIESVSMTLNNSLVYNVKVPDIVEQINGFVTFTMAGKSVVVTDYIKKDGYCIFAFSDIGPQYMTETITASLIVNIAGAETVASTYSTTLKDYCEDVSALDNTYKPLVNAVLNYGAAAQIYKNYNVNKLANSSLSLSEKILPECDCYNGIDKEYIPIDNAKINWKSIGLKLEEKAAMKLVFSADENTQNLSVKVESEWFDYITDISDFLKIGNTYIFYYDDFNIDSLDEIYLFTVYENGKPVSNTVSYSVESYASVALEKGDANLVNLIKALMNYSTVAKSY